MALRYRFGLLLAVAAESPLESLEAAGSLRPNDKWLRSCYVDAECSTSDSGLSRVNPDLAQHSTVHSAHELWQRRSRQCTVVG
jgi:hypothetical protein